MFDNLSNEINTAYDNLNTERQKLFDATELQLEKKRDYDRREAALRREGLSGANKDEREADLMKKIEPEAKSLEAANGTLRKQKYDHETAMLEVERIRAQIRILENIDYIKGRS